MHYSDIDEHENHDHVQESVLKKKFEEVRKEQEKMS